MSDHSLDLVALNELKSLMGDAFDLLLGKFSTTAHSYVDAIKNGIESGDVKQIMDAAHPLKSSSAQLGASQLSATAKALEMAAKSSPAVTPEMKTLAATLPALLSNALVAIKAA